MKRRFRLTGSADFQRVRRSGKAVRHPLLVMVYLPNDLEASRIGVVAGRVVGNAVKRNRAKRLIRSAMLPYLPEIPAGWDVLVVARKPILEAGFQQIQEALNSLLQRSILYQGIHETESR